MPHTTLHAATHPLIPEVKPAEPSTVQDEYIARCDADGVFGLALTTVHNVRDVLRLLDFIDVDLAVTTSFKEWHYTGVNRARILADKQCFVFKYPEQEMKIKNIHTTKVLVIVGHRAEGRLKVSKHWIQAGHTLQL